MKSIFCSLIKGRLFNRVDKEKSWNILQRGGNLQHLIEVIKTRMRVEIRAMPGIKW